MITIILAVAALALTCAMFATRSMMLGFPCLIFWAIFGGQCYTLSGAVWDMYYILFFACEGMGIFMMYAAFALRSSDLEAPKRDWLDSGKFIDEGKDKKGDGLPEESEHYIDETSSPSRRTQELHERAATRRTGGRRKTPWGEFK